MSQTAPQSESVATSPTEEIDRPLYVRRVPEAVWNRVHENALRSRMRLSAYLVKLMEQSHPFPPQPLSTRRRARTGSSPTQETGEGRAVPRGAATMTG